MKPGGRARAAAAVLAWGFGLGAGGIVPAQGASKAAAEFDWGFLASRHADADGVVRFKAAGPIWERAVSPSTNALAVRPFYATDTDPASGWRHYNYAWPVGEAARLGDALSWRVLLAWGTDYNLKDPHSRYRTWWLPFYFEGRDAAGRTYHAVFPFGGNLREFYGRDIQFVLFPIWAKSSINGVETRDWLFPIYSTTHGKGVDRFRVAPFYGYSKLAGSFDKRFVLWPFYTQVRYDFPHSKGFGYLVFPLWGHLKLSDQESWMIVPPFFRFAHGQDLDFVLAPWPFVQWQAGQRSRFYLWPLFGRTVQPAVEDSFALWPIYHHEKIDRDRSILRRYRVMPFVYYDTERLRYRRAPGGGDLVAGRFELWPLASWERDGGARRFRCPDLWPGRDLPPIARSWAPLWTLADYRAQGANADFELLWGLFRRASRGSEMARTSLFPLVEWGGDRRGGADASSWSLLKGLCARSRDGLNTRWRVLYFLTFGTGESAR